MDVFTMFAYLAFGFSAGEIYFRYKEREMLNRVRQINKSLDELNIKLGSQ